MNHTYAHLIQNSIALFALSFLLTLIIINIHKKLPLTFRCQHDLTTVQSMHEIPTPRIGGISIFLSMQLMTIMAPASVSEDLYLFMAATTIIFFTGLLEDIGLYISAKTRLFACATSSFIAIILLDAWMPRIGIPFLDASLLHYVVGAIITIFITSSVANGFNLIDGVNGLAAMVGITTSVCLAIIAFKAEYYSMTELCVMLSSCILGFFVINYPHGRIFLGDAGAYTIGFILSWFGIAILINNPTVTPWAILLTMFWPLADTLLAIHRRRSKKVNAMRPDRLHAHQMVMRTLEMSLLGRHRRKIANPITTAVLSPFVITPPIVGVFLWDNNKLAFLATITFLILFFGSYYCALKIIPRLPRVKDYSRPQISLAEPKGQKPFGHQ